MKPARTASTLHRLVLVALLIAPGVRPASADAGASAEPAAPPVAASAFYGNADIEAAALSPSGRWLALSKPLPKGRMALLVYDVRDWKPLGVAAAYEDADVEDFDWVNDERLVYKLGDRTRSGGDQRYWPGLVAVNRDGSAQRRLVDFDWHLLSPSGRKPLAPNHRLLQVHTDNPDEIIVGEWRYDDKGEFITVVPKRIDTVSGDNRPIALGAPAHVNAWLFDGRGEPRLAVTQHDGRGAVHLRDDAAKAWRVVAEYPHLRPPWRPLAIDADGGLYVAVDDGAGGTAVIKRFDAAAGKPQSEAFVSTPGFDARAALVRESPAAPTLGVRVLTDAETTVWFDKTMAALQDKADQRLSGHVNRLNCRRCGQPDMTVLVNSWSDRDPGQIWIYSAADDSWRKVGNRREAIDPRRMARVTFQRIATRDARQMPLWLTLPSPEARKRAAVLLVHGGPWERGGDWRWQADAQFLAAQGYVVIEPEFRGSTGYGNEWFRAGIRQWGRAMQDDLLDALQWTVDQGLVDARRVCIAGASYGGYATLMALARDPEVFRCGVAWAAVSDPRLMFKWNAVTDVGSDGRNYTYPELIGDPAADAAMLDRVTPLLLAASIKAPLLLAHGGSDRRVPIEHGVRMRNALAEAGHPSEWIEYPGEGHGWYRVSNQIDFARRMEGFLAKYLK